MVKHSDNQEDIAPAPSKTQVKRQMHDLQVIGERLVALRDDQLDGMDLPERLHEAVCEAKRINKFGARRRQMQFIGKLMREVEAEPIISRLGSLEGNSRLHSAWLHRLENWRDRLLEDEAALTKLLNEHPGADAQRLRTLIRNTLKERELGKPPKSYRELFQALREILPEQGKAT
mgnify:CR=1 FL=1